MNTSDNRDLAPIEKALDLLAKIISNPGQYQILESQADLGSSRQAIDEEHAVQRVGLHLSFIDISGRTEGGNG